MKSDRTALMREKARNIIQRCEALKSNEMFFLLKRNLESALAADNDETPVPVVISLTGGTGVGKSFIFSTLCSTPEISPSSGSVRGFTRNLYISGSEEDLKMLPFSRDEVHFLPGLIPGAVLIDTPDLDTIDCNNARIARETLSVSDIIICVTTPDKRANFSIHKNIIEWASRKRWFFVINKTDTAADVDADTLKAELALRLEHLGFSVDQAALFTFSARNPDSEEFRRFRDTVFSQRTVAHSRILREEAETRRFLHAANAENKTSGMLKLFQELTAFRTNLSERVQTRTQEIVSSPAICGMANDALRSSLYRELAGNGSFFLFPYFAVINWLTPRVSPEATEQSVKAALTSDFKLTDCLTSARRFLEDRQLVSFSGSDRPDDRIDIHGTHGEISLQIVEEAQKKSETALLRFYIVAGNILPFLVLLQTLYRSTISWAQGVWLPGDFFIHALFLMVVATVPGYLLIAKAVKRFSSSYRLNTATQNANLPGLDSNISAIDKTLQDLCKLTAAAEKNLEALQKQLPHRTFGISTRT